MTHSWKTRDSFAKRYDSFEKETWLVRERGMIHLLTRRYSFVKRHDLFVETLAHDSFVTEACLIREKHMTRSSRDMTRSKERQYSFVTPVAGPIFRPLSTRLIHGFHFADCLISRFNFAPNSSNLVSQVLLCAKRFFTLNWGISFRRIQILLISFWKRDRENVFYKCSNSGQMFLRRKIFSDEIRKILNLEIKQSSK